MSLLSLVAPLAIIDLILVAVALVDMFRRGPRRVRGPIFVWVLVVLLIGTFGPIIYFIFGRRD